MSERIRAIGAIRERDIRMVLPDNTKNTFFALQGIRFALTLLHQVRRRLGNTEQKF